MRAEDRRTEVVEVALRHFAVSGYAGTSTEAIAKEAGISQPYLFRLFGTKKELFVACIEENNRVIVGAFEKAAEGVPKEERLQAMGPAYKALLEDRTQLLMQMQGYAATADPELQAHVRRCWEKVFRTIQRLTGLGDGEVWQFMGHGMMLNVVAALELAVEGSDAAWSIAYPPPEDC